MTDEVPVPSIDGVQSAEFDIERNVDAPTSILSRTMQRSVRSGDRWMGSLSFPPAKDDEAGVISGFLRQATRGNRWFWLSPPHAGVRGNWNPPDLVANGTFIADTANWTAESATLSVNARRLKVKATSAAASAAYQNITMEAGKPHAVIADGYRGSQTAGRVNIRRQSDNVNEVDSGALTMPSRAAFLAAPSVAAMRVQVRNEGVVSGGDVAYSGISVTRCLQVNGAAQTGNRLNVDGGPAGVNAALKAGEFVCFPVTPGSVERYQLVQLVEDFDSDSSGAGTLVFEPGLRASPADNAPVIVRYPFGRFFIPDHRAPDILSPPIFHGFAISVLEDITP